MPWQRGQSGNPKGRHSKAAAELAEIKQVLEGMRVRLGAIKSFLRNNAGNDAGLIAAEKEQRRDF